MAMKNDKVISKTNSPSEKPINQRRKKSKLLYIKCAEQIIRNEGVSALNIRRIAMELGNNSATLYTYFEDIEELIIYCTFKIRKEYLEHLARELNTDMSPLEQYVKFYEIYCYYSFDEPEIYYNMYFGKYGERLYRIRDAYYELFPTERVQTTPMIDSMLWARNVYEGERNITRYLAEQGYIEAKNADMIANIIVRVHSSYMHDLFTYKHMSATLARHEFLDSLLHILSVNSPKKLPS